MLSRHILLSAPWSFTARPLVSCHRTQHNTAMAFPVAEKWKGITQCLTSVLLFIHWTPLFAFSHYSLTLLTPVYASTSCSLSSFKSNLHYTHTAPDVEQKIHVQPNKMHLEYVLECVLWPVAQVMQRHPDESVLLPQAENKYWPINWSSTTSPTSACKVLLLLPLLLSLFHTDSFPYVSQTDSHPITKDNFWLLSRQRLAAALSGRWPLSCLGNGANQCKPQAPAARLLLFHTATFAHCPSPCQLVPAAAWA